MNHRNATRYTGELAGSLFLGLFVGAAVALLYAPRSGKATRAELYRRSRFLRRRAGDAVDEVREQIAESGARVAATIDERREDLAAAVRAGREALHLFKR
jgi:gas vesicle protein